MSKEFALQPETDNALYEIRLRGHLSIEWADWFDGLAITQQADGTTLLRGHIADQAALYGVLKRIRDLGVPLLAIICVEYCEEKTKYTQDRS